MGTFQEKLINNDFELIASELFSGDPRLQLENLKVGFQTTRFISASTRNFLDIVKRFSTQKLTKVSTSLNDIIGRRQGQVNVYVSFCVINSFTIMGTRWKNTSSDKKTRKSDY